MAFNIGLSGLRAASTDLEVRGNNVANASTTGFKKSRAEFGDIYTNSLLGTGSKQVGSGVLTQTIRQSFSQENITGTERALDLAVDGNGFFVISDLGSLSYTRAGIFNIDRDGYVVATNGARLQGFPADDLGTVTGVLGDIEVQLGNQAPQLTTRVTSVWNLDSGADIKQELGSQYISNGLAIGVPDAGIPDSTSTILSTAGQPTTAGTATYLEFTVDLSAAGVGPSAGGETLTLNLGDGTGPQTITLNAIPAQATNAAYQAALRTEIQTQLNNAFGANEVAVSLTPGPPADVIRFTRSGYDATTDTASPGANNMTLTASNAAWDAAVGPFAAANALLVPGAEGANLFVGTSPILADFRSIPGTSTTTRTVATPPLTITPLVPGTNATLTGSGLVGGATFDFSGAQSIVFNLEYTDSTATTTTVLITLDNANFTGGGSTAGVITAVTTAEIVAEINQQITDPPASLVGEVNVTQVGNNIQFNGLNAGNGDTIVLVQGATATYDLTSLGFSATNRTAAGTADVLANNVFSMQVTDTDVPTTQSNAFDITIPTATYASLDDLATAIQGQMDLLIGAGGLSGRVSVDAVGGQLVFTNTEVGSNFGLAITNATTDPASTSFNALGFNNLFVVPGTDTIDRSNSFRVNLTVPAPDADGRSGTAVITLDEEYRSVQQLAASINRQISSLDDDAYIGVRAEAIEIVPNVVPPQFQLQFVATEAGEASVITVNDFSAPGADVTVEEMYGLLQVDEDNASLLVPGIEGVTNEYPETQVTIVDPNGDETVVTIPEDTEANEIASIFNKQAGITATATSQVKIPINGYNNPTNSMRITLNNQLLSSTSFTELVEEIQSLTSTRLPGFSAEIDDNGDLIISNSIGRDIKIAISSPTVTDSLIVQGVATAGPVLLGGTSTADTAARVGGTIEFILSEKYTMKDPVPSISGIFGALTEDEYTDFVLNSFNPDNSDTYNFARSHTIYDSLGNAHELTQFFVKEPLDPTRPNEENIWTMYVQVDGNDVGDPDPTLPFPENLEPTQANYELFFDPDGTLDVLATGEIYVTNWDPQDADGNPTGALSSINVLEGGLPLTDPPNSSNFQIDLGDTTQVGSDSAVILFNQDGYTTGRLNSLEVDKSGILFARYTNGQARVLAQVALASFQNPEGLTPVGDTAWGQSFESGVPTIGSPRTGPFGEIRAASLEDSNVDLSEELVGLIIAQRNFQANAKTIETSDAVTQTIINI